MKAVTPKFEADCQSHPPNVSRLNNQANLFDGLSARSLRRIGSFKIVVVIVTVNMADDGIRPNTLRPSARSPLASKKRLSVLSDNHEKYHELVCRTIKRTGGVTRLPP